MGWGNVMRAWGSGGEKVVGKFFELLFNSGLSEEQARDPALPVLAKQRPAGTGGGVGGLFKKFHPPPLRKVSLRLGTSTR